jgi:hypothetical protein
MSNWNAPQNITLSDDEVFPQAQVDIALTVFSLLTFGLCTMVVVVGLCRRLSEEEEEELQAYSLSQERKEERKRQRKEFILSGLIVKEWEPDDDAMVVVEPAKGDDEDKDDTPPSVEAVEQAPQSLAPKINSLLAYAMGSDDCESCSEGEDEKPGCAICLSHFKPPDLVCESNNASCKHVFHKDCMVDWLTTKQHDDCPLCREVYLLETV